MFKLGLRRRGREEVDELVAAAVAAAKAYMRSRAAGKPKPPETPLKAPPPEASTASSPWVIIWREESSTRYSRARPRGW